MSAITLSSLLSKLMAKPTVHKHKLIIIYKITHKHCVMSYSCPTLGDSSQSHSRWDHPQRVDTNWRMPPCNSLLLNASCTCTCFSFIRTRLGIVVCGKFQKSESLVGETCRGDREGGRGVKRMRPVLNGRPCLNSCRLGWYCSPTTTYTRAPKPAHTHPPSPKHNEGTMLV